MTCSANATFSDTVLLGSSRKSWKTVPIWRRSRGTFHPASRLISLPATYTRPEVGRSRAGPAAGRWTCPTPRPRRGRRTRPSRCRRSPGRGRLALAGVGLGDLLEANHVSRVVGPPEPGTLPGLRRGRTIREATLRSPAGVGRRYVEGHVHPRHRRTPLGDPRRARPLVRSSPCPADLRLGRRRLGLRPRSRRSDAADELRHPRRGRGARAVVRPRRRGRRGPRGLGDYPGPSPRQRRRGPDDRRRPRRRPRALVHLWRRTYDGPGRGSSPRRSPRPSPGCWPGRSPDGCSVTRDSPAFGRSVATTCDGTDASVRATAGSSATPGSAARSP